MTENSQLELIQKLMSQSHEQSQILLQLKNQIATLEQQIENQIKSPNVPNAKFSATPTTSRRKMLTKLGTAMVAGLAAVNFASGAPAQARIIPDPSSAIGRVGAVIVPSGIPTPVGTPTISSANYGLVVTDGSDSSFDLSKLPGSTGIYSNGSDYGVFAKGSIYGVSGNGSSTGVLGNGSTTGVSGNGGTYGVSGFGTTYGIHGLSQNISVNGEGGKYGVVGKGSVAGIYGSDSGNSSVYAGFFDGKVGISGTLSKGGGSFKIDHPLDPANKYLYHSFVESPDMLNIYNGVTALDGQGEATIQLPDWFETLNRDFRYQLTPVGSYASVYIAQEVQNNSFKIAGGKPGQNVSWQLTGIRQDKWALANRIPVEEEKSSHEKGKYLHPELYGADKGALQPTDKPYI